MLMYVDIRGYVNIHFTNTYCS